MDTDIRLTRYSHGSGCGCKIAPALLDKILRSTLPVADDARLIVGNEGRDDAAVYDLGDGRGIISTTDFFMPIVDDPFDFGRIAATNAISDIYAMGGTPLVSIAILGWPVDKLPAEVASLVIDGGRQACAEAGISLAGGHSIDAPEPLFGLAVTGIVDLEQLKRNSGAQAGDALYLTKPLGIGILTTALKRGLLQTPHLSVARDTMVQNNAIGMALAKIEGVTALTDVTGFGLLGHLLELCRASGLSGHLKSDRVTTLPGVEHYIGKGCIPGGCERNFASYGGEISTLQTNERALLCDPQTSGGLLIAARPETQGEVESLLRSRDLPAQCIGHLSALGDGVTVTVE